MMECPLDFFGVSIDGYWLLRWSFTWLFMGLSVFQTFEVPDNSQKKKGAVSSFERSN